MPNPNPKTSQLKKYKPQGNEALAEQQLQIRLPQDVDAAIRNLGKGKTAWMRRVLSEAARRELMGDLEQ